MLIQITPLPAMPPPVFLAADMAVSAELEALVGVCLPEAEKQLAKFEQHLPECQNCPDAEFHWKTRAELLAIKCQVEERVNELCEYLQAPQ
jgi:hypothetical protein